MSPRSITMSLMGGLGNQLFQFATGLEVAHRSGAPLQLDLSWFEQSLRRVSDGLLLRPYELDGIADDIPKVPPPQSRRGELLRHGRDVLVRRGFRLVNRLPVPYWAESGADFNPEILKAGPGTHLWGYFSSWRYFTTVARHVRARVLESPTISSWARETEAQAAAEGVIALHVRRGDYLNLASTYGHVATDYYRRALALLRSMNHHGPVWLYSDEPAGAREFLAGVTVDRLVDPPPSASSLDSMVAMSGAGALVLANSTYSWWAAFLGEAPQRHVIAPRPMWATSASPEPRDMLLPGWITLDARRFD
jgi:hypothetical protein